MLHQEVIDIILHKFFGHAKVQKNYQTFELDSILSSH